MRLTKNAMARVIVQALYALPSLPAADHTEVVKRANRGTVAGLTRHHKLAVEALLSVQRQPTAAQDHPDRASVR